MGAGRKTQTVDVDTKAFGLHDFEARQRNLGQAQLKGAIFGAQGPMFKSELAKSCGVG